MAEGTAIAFATRAGNTKKPDDTWSDWSDELTTAEGSQIPNADGQYIQWRGKFTTSDTSQTPILKKVTLASVQTNVEPRFTSIEIDDGSGSGNQERGRRASGGNLPPPGSRSGDSGGSGNANNAPSKNWKVSWKVEDPNADTLQYTLYYKATDESNWRLLKKELAKANYEWDVTTVPDGRYTLKVVATDKLSNPVGWAKSAEKVSRPVGGWTIRNLLSGKSMSLPMEITPTKSPVTLRICPHLSRKPSIRLTAMSTGRLSFLTMESSIPKRSSSSSKPVNSPKGRTPLSFK